ncbi:uncharacterized protein LOC108047211 [Drosophila rhopaloa]|uniref:Uncharacterized protein LOC108047211 n=1 Tax=Drosophila rhopaloa TaxID=1041015 RepID=A0A6P4EXC0_DRORH|nr:uncharacterized protein LOC108047211 [Drosophila rhopaloa]
MYYFGICIFYAVLGYNLFAIVNLKKRVYAHSIDDSRQQMHIPECNLNAQLAIINAVQMKTLRKLEQIKKQTRLNIERFQKDNLEKFERIQKETLKKTKRLQKDERCVVTDAPIQCGGFCLSALHPLIDDISHVQQEIDNQKESQANIKISQKETLAILQEILLKLTAIQKVNEASLGNSKEELDTFPRDTPKREEIESPFIPPGFQLIGSRYFNIVADTKNWADAEVNCRQRGGYLAAIQNQEEYDVIKPKLMEGYWYWLGINDLQEKGQYKSVASGNLAPFLMWNALHHNSSEGNCASLINDEMYNSPCEDKKYFICQFDKIV